MSWLLLIFPLLFIMLLFPDGRPPSPRWRWVFRAGLGLVTFFLIWLLFAPFFTLTELGDWTIVNPIGFLPVNTPFLDTAWSVAIGYPDPSLCGRALRPLSPGHWCRAAAD